MAKTFSEATRVQIPAILHLTQLGYKYIGRLYEETAGETYDSETNILIDEFKNSFERINPGKEKEWHTAFTAIKTSLANDDLGKDFYQKLTNFSPYKLIDFENPNNNSFLVTGEFTCKNGENEFRPDITLFINGLPLVFIEVKKPNNSEGIVAEYKRMCNERFTNKAFKKFINITQFMIFSNNMEYDSLGGITPIQGSFYCSSSKNKAFFNCFREENPQELEVAPFIANYPYKKIDENIEKKVLKDFNCQVIFNQPEYITNKNFNTPTNRILTSMCSPERILYIIKYGIAYVKSEKEVDGKLETSEEKHIMRYQQLFATIAIQNTLSKGLKSGIIWHTQGSGKTALSYFLNYILTDYFAKQNKVAKFYFIVDRIDLLKQASEEFTNRGLIVNTVNSRKELMDEFAERNSKTNAKGSHEITVVNIQKFAEDKEKVELPSYSTNLQRIFIVDEAHRGYDPTGTFLPNLFEADKDAIKIALTGTPLLKEEKASWKVFGEYIHTYYYDKSIADGYTVKLIREDIETSYKETLLQVQEKVKNQLKNEFNKSSVLNEKVLKKDVKQKDITKHEKYVKELLRYIIKDFVKFRAIQADATLGAMIVAENGEQAKALALHFDEIMAELMQAQKVTTRLTAKLITYDSDTKENQDKIIKKEFKKDMTLDMLIVDNMLLTGFDAPRLKKLYLGKKLKDHTLLQAITRVNRPYKEMPYGFLVDFADIKANFTQINEQYLKELGKFNEADVNQKNVENTFSQIIESPKNIMHAMKVIKNTLFNYELNNAEIFTNQINEIEDKKDLYEIKTALEDAKSMANLVRTFGDEEFKKMFATVKIEKATSLLSEVQRRIDLINFKEAANSDNAAKALINEAMLEITFNFVKVGEEELKIIAEANELSEKRKKVLHEFEKNSDPEDPKFITLHQAFIERFKQHGFKPSSMEEYKAENDSLDEIFARLKELNRKNENLLRKYDGDQKFLRIHKRVSEENSIRKSQSKPYMISEFEEDIVFALNTIKQNIDQKVFDRNNILKKDDYFNDTVYALVDQTLYKMNIDSEMETCDFIQSKVSRQYLNQYHQCYGMGM